MKAFGESSFATNAPLHIIFSTTLNAWKDVLKEHMLMMSLVGVLSAITTAEHAPQDLNVLLVMVIKLCLKLLMEDAIMTHI